MTEIAKRYVAGQPVTVWETQGKVDNIKPLVIGIGVAGKRHLEAQLNLGVKTGVYNINPAKTELLKKQKNIIVFDNLQEAINWSNLVHICTPDDKHSEFVAETARKGKAVLCEKSFTTNLSDALYLQGLAHKYNAVLIVGQNYRLAPTFAETRKRVLEGQIGTITKIETTYFHDRTDYQLRYGSRKKGDFLYIGGSHAVDLACWVAGEQIVGVKTTSAKKLSYQIIVRFSSGLLGDIKLDASSPQPRSGTDLKVFGEKGKLVSHNKLDKLLFYTKGNQKPQSISLPNLKTYTIPLEIKIVDNFLLGKTTSHWPLPNVDEAVNTIRVLDTIQKSVLSGKEELISH